MNTIHNKQHRWRIPSLSLNNLVIFIFVMGLVGYPLIAFLHTQMAPNSPTTLFTIPYRVAMFSLCFVAIALSITNKRTVKLPLFFCFFLCFYMVRLGYDWSTGIIPDADYALLFFSTTIIAPSIVILLNARFLSDEIVLAKMISIVGCLGCIWALSLYLSGSGFNPWADQGVSNNRLSFVALNPIRLGYLGATTLIAAVFLLNMRLTVINRVIILACIVFSGSIIVLANSRGPILAILIALSWMVLKKRPLLFIWAPTAFVFASLLGVTERSEAQEILSRFESIFTGKLSIDVAIQERLNAQLQGIDAFLSSPLYGAYYIDPTLGVGKSPHNLIIETAMAMGILGLIPLFAMIITAWTRLQSKQGQSGVFLSTLLLFQLLASLISGTIWGHDTLFLMIALSSVFLYKPQNRPSSIRKLDKPLLHYHQSISSRR